jgi:PAS domain S-box-containing protein
MNLTHHEIRAPHGWTIHVPLLLAAVLVVLSSVHYLWFHTLAEMFAITTGITLYLVARASFVFNRNRFLLFIAQGFFWAACVDTVHTLSYRGMGLIAGDDANPATQLWLIARFLEAGTLLLAPLYLKGRPERDVSFWVMGALALGGIALVFGGLFPAAFIEGQGLTPFKVVSEYLIIALLGGAAWHLWRRRARLDAELYRVLLAIIAFTAVSEFAFTLYVSAYGLSNLVGHVFKLWAFWLLLLVVFRWMLAEPFRMLSKDARSFDHIPIPVLLLDADGVIQVANPRALAERPEGVPGQRMHDTWAPRGLAEADCEVCLAIAAGRAVVTEMHDPERDVWYSIHLQPIKREDKVLGFVCAQINVTEQKRSQLALVESNRQAQDLYDQAPCGYHSLDGDGVIVNINQTELDMLGYTREELVGRRKFDDLMTPASREACSRLFPVLLERGHVDDQEFELVRKDGSTLTVNLSATAVRDDAGRFLYSRSTFMDVTRRRRAEERLLQTEKMELVGQMAGGLAHDFNNLLGVIMGSLDLLGNGLTDERARRQLDLANRAAQRGAEVTRSLLAVARRQALSPARLNLRDAVAEVLPLIRQAVGRQIEVHESRCAECNAGLLTADLDLAGLGSALLNLAVNARDAMAGGGKLTIDTRYRVIGADEAGAPAGLKPGQYAVISVSDNGSGMPRAVAARAFEPFFTTKPQGRGTGLGLAMVYGFARQSGGTATLYSQPGVGTTLRLYLPVLLEAVSGAWAPGAAEDAGSVPMGAGERLLLVDDEADLLDITRQWLSGLGYSVRAVASPGAALGLLESETFDILVTDVVMPDEISGIELAGMARDLQPDIRVLLISGFAGDLGQGDWPRLAKPYSRRELARTVREVFAAGRPAGTS